MHLTSINPYVASTVGDWENAHGLRPFIPRTCAPLPMTSSRPEELLSCTSSFGMSGVNAHAVFYSVGMNVQRNKAGVAICFCGGACCQCILPFMMTGSWHGLQEMKCSAERGTGPCHVACFWLSVCCPLLASAASCGLAYGLRNLSSLSYGNTR
jgi:hypothetical protein